MRKTRFVLLFIACWSIMACKSKAPGQYQGYNETATCPVITIQPQSVTNNIDVPATIQGEQVVEIRPKVDGYIEGIYVNEGATVKKGQLLFKIDNPQYPQDLRTAQAGIKTAQADVSTAEMNVEKAKPLVEQEIISKYELTSAQYTLDSKRAALAQAEAALANAEANVAYTIIRSPENGVIGTIPYKVGALVSSTSANPLTTMSNASNVFAYMSMDEKELLNFQARMSGANLQDKLDHYPAVSLILANGQLYPVKGKLVTADGSIDTETGSISMKATFPNKQGVITNGASGVVVIPVTLPSAIVVPQSATYEMQDKRLVYVLADSNKVNAVSIQTTATDNGKYFIVSKGLQPGDKIVVAGIGMLRDGVKINPTIGNADSVFSNLKH